MAVISKPREVKRILQWLRKHNACIPAFGTENALTTESIIVAAHETGRKMGIPRIPVMLAFTGHYPSRQQLANYTVTNNVWDGFLAVRDDVYRLAGKGAKFYSTVNVMVHFDHGHPELDHKVFEAGKNFFSSVMYDCSHLNLKTNMARTAVFVKNNRNYYLVEGVVDEIYESGTGAEKNVFTDPVAAEKYVHATGVDLIVVNLGTEHRAAVADIKYDHARARSISRRVGKMLVLHGTSSLPEQKLARLSGDGIIKVNIWTMLEKTGTAAVVLDSIHNLGCVLPPQELKALKEKNVITEKFYQRVTRQKMDLRYFTYLHMRNDSWIPAVQKKMGMFYSRFGYHRLG
ncbi:MAG: class II fructose-bisphosphate aldolase [Elusimicrobiota bacterium]